MLFRPFLQSRSAWRTAARKAAILSKSFTPGALSTPLATSTAHGLATLWLDGALEDRIGPVDLEATAEHVFEVLTAV